LADGARGDNDGAANGTITDPGGPVVVLAPTPPTDTPPPVTPVTPVAPTIPPTPSAPVTPIVASPDTATLPQTGTSTLTPIAVALLLFVLGVVAVGVGRVPRDRGRHRLR
ncbi:MAG: hypothetical protein WBP59_17695, partial [Ilumatobacteraceae bacterium]